MATSIKLTASNSNGHTRDLEFEAGARERIGDDVRRANPDVDFGELEERIEDHINGAVDVLGIVGTDTATMSILGVEFDLAVEPEFAVD